MRHRRHCNAPTWIDPQIAAGDVLAAVRDQGVTGLAFEAALEREINRYPSRVRDRIAAALNRRLVGAAGVI